MRTLSTSPASLGQFGFSQKQDCPMPLPHPGEASTGLQSEGERVYKLTALDLFLLKIETTLTPRDWLSKAAA